MEKFLKIKFWQFIPLIILLGLLNSCTDDPNSVGNALIPENDRLKSTKIETYSESFTSFQKDSLFFGSSGKILLGSYKNISSEALLAFIILLPDSIEEQLTNNEVVLKSSWIEMYPNYWIGDSTNFSFTVHKINEHWNPIELNQDTINDIHVSLGPNILESITKGDTVIKFSIDNELVENWVRRSFDDTYPEDNGILLAPLSNTGIVGFQALTSFPSDIYPLLHLEFEKEGEFIDTVLALPKLDIHIPTGERLLDPVNGVLLQGSINVRGKLKFNIETVPKDVLINSAILDLFVDEANTFEGTAETDSIALSFYQNSGSDSINIEFGRYPLVKKDGKYSGNISQFVQRWLDGEPNEGMEVKLTDENRSASAVSFYNNEHPNESQKPRLTIYYTIK
jgi:hypothetical protein